MKFFSYLFLERSWQNLIPDIWQSLAMCLYLLHHLSWNKELEDGSLSCPIDEKELQPYLPLFDRVFDTFAAKDSWSLSSIAHGEYVWQKAKRGYAPDDACTVEIETDDIRVDADRIRQRRFVLEHLKTPSPQA